MLIFVFHLLDAKPYDDLAQAKSLVRRPSQKPIRRDFWHPYIVREKGDGGKNSEFQIWRIGDETLKRAKPYNHARQTKQCDLKKYYFIS